MLHDKPNVITELAWKGPRFVEIIEIMVCLDIPFYFSSSISMFCANHLAVFLQLMIFTLIFHSWTVNETHWNDSSYKTPDVHSNKNF